jgi:fucose permease
VASKRLIITKIKPESQIGLILLAFIAFISLGLPDGLLGVAWPSIRGTFSRPLDSLGVLLFAIMAGYLTSSFFSGHLIARLGVGKLLAASCAATGAGLIGYTLAPTWWMIVACGAITGLGAGAIDASLNSYIAANFGEGLMQWLHASWGIGVTIGPMIMTTGIKFFDSWRWGYVLVGAVQLTLAACFTLTGSLWQRRDDPIESEKSQRLTDDKTPFLQTLRQPPVWLSILFFFLYTGIEATLGNWAYTLLTESRGILPQVAGFWTGSYWATFTMGRVLAGLYAKRIGVHALIRISLLAAFGEPCSCGGIQRHGLACSEWSSSVFLSRPSFPAWFPAPADASGRAMRQIRLACRLALQAWERRFFRVLPAFWPNRLPWK